MPIFIDEFFNQNTKNAISEAQVQKYVDRTARHVDQNEPYIRGSKSDEELKDFIQYTYKKAVSHSLIYERDHLSFLTVSSFWGPDFLSDPQFLYKLVDEGLNVKKPSMPMTRMVWKQHFQKISTDIRFKGRTSSHLGHIYRSGGGWETDRTIRVSRKAWPTTLQDIPDHVLAEKVKICYTHFRRYDTLSIEDVVMCMVVSMAIGFHFDDDFRFPKVKSALISELEKEEKSTAIWDALLEEFALVSKQIEESTKI